MCGKFTFFQVHEMGTITIGKFMDDDIFLFEKTSDIFREF